MVSPFVSGNQAWESRTMFAHFPRDGDCPLTVYKRNERRLRHARPQFE